MNDRDFLDQVRNLLEVFDNKHGNTREDSRWPDIWLSAQEKLQALEVFFKTWTEGGLLEDTGPSLSCNECDALFNLLEVFGHKQAAEVLLHAHCLQDSEAENDCEAHLEIKAELEDRKCRYCGQPAISGVCPDCEAPSPSGKRCRTCIAEERRKGGD